MRSFCRTRTTGCVGTWRSDQTSAFAYQIKCNRVIGHPYSDSIHSSGCCHRNGIAFPDDHRQGTRPESTGQFAGSLRNFTCNTFHIGKVRNVHDQGVVRRTSFCCIDFAGSFRMQGISAKTVYRFCRKSDQFTLCDQTSGLFHNCFVNLFGIDTFYFCIHHIHTLLSALYPVYYSP